MLVFIDESGDPGFNVAEGAAPVFVVAMAIFDNGDDAARTHKAIEGSDARKMHKGEFKFSKCCDNVRDAFFIAVRNCPFKVRSIVARKSVIYSPKLRADKDKFYEFFVNQMISHDNGMLKDARIIIDGSGDREFRRNLNSAMRRKLGGIIKDVRFKESHRDPLVQLADMCAGAIARSYRQDRTDRRRWRKMLAPRLNDVWDFQ